MGWIPSNARHLQLARNQIGGDFPSEAVLDQAPLPPGTEETFQVLQARRPQVVVREFPEEVRAFEFDSPVVVDKQIFLKCLKSVPKGASPGPGGCSYELVLATSLAPGEHLCAFLDDVYLLCAPERVVPLYMLLSDVFAREAAGIRLHEG